MLTKNEVLDTLRVLSTGLRSPVWLVGGVAADFHVGRWTRDHGDIDLVGFEEHRGPLHDELAELGFAQTDDRGWITHWTRSGRDVGEISIAYEERVDAVTGRLVIRPEHAGDALVPGTYLGVPGNLDPSRHAEIDGVRFRVASAADEWVFTKGYRAFRPGARPRASVEHNLRLLESVLTDEERERLRPFIAMRAPLRSPTGETRQWALRDERDVVAMQRLASRLWPLGLHPGGLGWVAAGQFGDEIALFADGDDLLGFAGVDEPGVLLAQADPARPDVADAIIAWFLEHDMSSELRVDVVDRDAAWRTAVEDAGFVRLEHERPVFHMRREASPGVPAPPDGYTVRNVEPHETEARIQVHRASWNPHELPWHPDHRPNYPADARSTHGDEAYACVRRTWLYEPRLDLVAVAPDGSFAGCCIVWFDPVSATAEIEPLGVVPEHRRRGVAGALCDEAVRRVAAAGGLEVIINNGPNEGYPAPAGAYAKAGFQTIDRGRTYALRR